MCYRRRGHEGEVEGRAYGGGMEGEQSKKVGKQVVISGNHLSKQM